MRARCWSEGKGGQREGERESESENERGVAGGTLLLLASSRVPERRSCPVRPSRRHSIREEGIIARVSELEDSD